MHAAARGRKSGLTAMAPTTRMPVAVEDAVGRDDPGDGHEDEEAGDRPRLLAGLAKQVGPDDRAAPVAPASASGLQPLEAKEPHVLGGHAEGAERVQRRVGRVGIDVRGHERLSVTVARVRAHDVRGARQRGDALGHALHDRRGTEHAQMQHRLATLASGPAAHLTRSG